MPIEKDKELELEKLRLEDRREQRKADAEAQQRRIAFWTAIITTIVSGILGPILLSVYHVNTASKIQEVKEESTKAATHAAAAVTVASQEAAKLDEKVDANLAQWKAYNTKEPEDMEKAAKALAKAEKPNGNQIIYSDAKEVAPASPPK